MDDNINGAWAFVCLLYRIREKNVRGIVKAKRGLEVLPPIHGALEMHIIKANQKAKNWLQADHVIMDLESNKLTLLAGGKKIHID